VQGSVEGGDGVRGRGGACGPLSRLRGVRVTPWFQLDTRLGCVGVQLDEATCFDAEAYAGDIDFDADIIQWVAANTAAANTVAANTVAATAAVGAPGGGSGGGGEGGSGSAGSREAVVATTDEPSERKVNLGESAGTVQHTPYSMHYVHCTAYSTSCTMSTVLTHYTPSIVCAVCGLFADWVRVQKVREQVSERLRML
jgi:hypothetical protein